MSGNICKGRGISMSAGIGASTAGDTGDSQKAKGPDTLLLNYKSIELLPALDHVLKATAEECSRHLIDSGQKAMDALADKACPWAMIRYPVRWSDIDSIDTDDTGDAESGDSREIRAELPVKRIMDNSCFAAAFVAGIGSGPEEEVASAFARREYAYAGMLDMGASLMVETLSELISQEVKELSTGPDLTGAQCTDTPVMCYSPGYCGWPLKGQAGILRFLEGGSGRVKVNSSWMLQPVKSITGLAIMAPFHQHMPVLDHSPCDKCDERSCIRRLHTRLRSESER